MPALCLVVMAQSLPWAVRERSPAIRANQECQHVWWHEFPPSPITSRSDLRTVPPWFAGRPCEDACDRHRFCCGSARSGLRTSRVRPFPQAPVVRERRTRNCSAKALRKTVYAVNKDEPLSRASATSAGRVSRSSQTHKMGTGTPSPMKPSATLELLLAPLPNRFSISGGQSKPHARTTKLDSIPIACRVRRKRGRLPSNVSIRSDPALKDSATSQQSQSRVTPDRVIASGRIYIPLSQAEVSNGRYASAWVVPDALIRTWSLRDDSAGHFDGCRPRPT